MLARTLTLALISSLAATAIAGGYDGGDRIEFKEIKKVNDDKFKKTNFDTHEIKVKDKDFNHVEKKDRDVLKVIKFEKEDDDDDHKHRRYGKHDDDDDKKHHYLKRGERYYDDKHDYKGKGRKHDGKGRKHHGKDRKHRYGKYDRDDRKGKWYA